MPARDPDRLTPYEVSFVTQLTRTDLAKPNSVVEAYERSYPAKANHRTNTNEASKIFNKPRVKAAIAEIEAKLEADRRRASRGNLQAINAAFWKLYEDPQATIQNKINALRGLASILPKDQKDESPLKDSAVSKADLQARLEEILSTVADKAIDVSPDQTTEQDIKIMKHTIDIDAEVISLTAEIESDPEPDY
jgi:hypothetical protein